MLKIVIVGSGAVGSLFGYYLASGGHDVWMVDKNEQLVDVIKEKGICKVNEVKPRYQLPGLINSVFASNVGGISGPKK